MTLLPKGWALNPHSSDDWEIEQFFADDGQCIMTVEGPTCNGAAIYAHALDPSDRLWKRGGAHRDRPSAKAWAERIAGLSPRKLNEYVGTSHHPLVGRHPSDRF